VDSEVLFRIARTRQDGRIDVAGLRRRLRNCRGQIAAVMASRRDPNTVLMIKGNNPLELRWSPRLRVAVYASAAAYLDQTLSPEDGWTILTAPAMTLLAMKRRVLPGYAVREMTFLAQATPTSGDFGRLRQPILEDL